MLGKYTGHFKGQTVLVCGSAPSLIDEYKKVKKALPYCKSIGVNESVAGVWCDFVYSYHIDKLNYFKSMSVNKDIEILDRNNYDITIGGTSCGDAIQIADIMGFSEIIMVGAPINGRDGYFNKTHMYDKDYEMSRFGSKNYSKETTDLQRNQRVIKELANKLTKVKSLSGYTAKVFGEWVE